ncbi:MAG: hypothetical protein KF852_17170 [Saprospiraceae bacterium]|nr:hypothetical protein [Saprospiraceae bacterium]
MPTQKVIAVVLIIAGIIMLAYTGFNYVTTETVVDLGPIQIEAKQNNFVALSPIIGGILLLGGIVLLVSNKRCLVSQTENHHYAIINCINCFSCCRRHSLADKHLHTDESQDQKHPERSCCDRRDRLVVAGIRAFGFAEKF